ncbi:MAG: hypothetical protein JW928_09880 [Candidatus Aureabacteria bacterium]|nr:hypothetical protein [Candidatus Auribacterota bacterium]
MKESREKNRKAEEISEARGSSTRSGQARSKRQDEKITEERRTSASLG